MLLSQQLGYEHINFDEWRKREIAKPTYTKAETNKLQKQIMDYVGQQLQAGK
ncbi:MAG: hypothetical protein H6765_07950 [Candidatus Peribacteria bacterium]|nr:MAG: hypothetical protein H6765_07950 [Candidatus Peribacteria bacterium]